MKPFLALPTALLIVVSLHATSALTPFSLSAHGDSALRAATGVRGGIERPVLTRSEVEQLQAWHQARNAERFARASNTQHFQLSSLRGPDTVEPQPTPQVSAWATYAGPFGVLLAQITWPNATLGKPLAGAVVFASSSIPGLNVTALPPNSTTYPLTRQLVIPLTGPFGNISCSTMAGLQEIIVPVLFTKTALSTAKWPSLGYGSPDLPPFAYEHVHFFVSGVADWILAIIGWVMVISFTTGVVIRSALCCSNRCKRKKH